MESVAQNRPRIAVTGIGLCTPIGNTLAEFSENLKAGRTGIQRHENVFTDRIAWAAIVADFKPEEHFTEAERERFDRTAQMGILAARQAINAAGAVEVPANRRALVFGTSHGGRSQLDRFVESGNDIEVPGTAERILEKAAHYHQAAAIASTLGVHGPCVTLSNACSSSGAAIAYAMELLRSGQCDWVIAGGADGFSKLTYSGFEALGAMADGPSAPFSDPIGMSLGDGAGFIVLERMADARQRGARIEAELYGWGLSWDAYHITAPEPSGEGMLRAIEMAMHDAGIEKHHIDYINVHGTGTRANDAAESVGLQRYFADTKTGQVPPLSATKSLTGHMLGASSALGVIASIVGMNHNWLPPTANFTTPRPGCELDVIPNVARSGSIRYFIAQSAAFAGANAVVIGGKPDQPTRSPIKHQEDTIVVSGIGVVSPLGCDLKSFSQAIEQGRSGLVSSDEAAFLGQTGFEVGWLRDYQPRKLMPALNLRRVDRVASFATIAASLALKDAGLYPMADGGKRTGLIAAITRGAATSYEKYLESVQGQQWKEASAVYFPNLVMSSVGGQVSSALGIRGLTSSLVGGGAAGLQALAHAIELFKRNDRQDSVIVVAADELSSLFFKLFARQGLLKGSSADNQVVLGEGAVAIVLEKQRSASERNLTPYAAITGYGLTHSGSPTNPQCTGHCWMTHAMRSALQQAKLQPTEIRRVQLLRSGRTNCDVREEGARKELVAMAQHASMTHLTGFAEASSCLSNLASLLIDMRLSRTLGHGIATAASDCGSNAAIVVSSMEMA